MADELILCPDCGAEVHVHPRSYAPAKLWVEIRNAETGDNTHCIGHTCQKDNS